MPEYNSLSALRGALTDDDADRRASAYSAVLGADEQPSDVLDSKPADEVIDSLVAAGVIPEPHSGSQVPAAEQRDRMVELLKQIAANTEA